MPSLIQSYTKRFPSSSFVNTFCNSYTPLHCNGFFCFEEEVKSITLFDHNQEIEISKEKHERKRLCTTMIHETTDTSIGRNKRFDEGIKEDQICIPVHKEKDQLQSCLEDQNW